MAIKGIREIRTMTYGVMGDTAEGLATWRETYEAGRINSYTFPFPLSSDPSAVVLEIHIKRYNFRPTF